MLLQKLRSNRGFTLIELMIVIAIVMIMIAIVIPNFIAYRERIKQKQMTPADITVQEETVTPQQDESNKQEDQVQEKTKGETDKL